MDIITYIEILGTFINYVSKFIMKREIQLKPIMFITLFFFTIIFLLFYSFDHTFSKSYHVALGKSTNLSYENIDGMNLGDNVSDEKIISKYGVIEKESIKVVGYHYYLLSEGIEIATDLKKNITRFILTDNRFKTSKGIKVGDQKDQIIEVYGKKYYERSEQGAQIIGYIDKKNDITLEFWLFDDKVNMYRLDKSSMK